MNQFRAALAFVSILCAAWSAGSSVAKCSATATVISGDYNCAGGCDSLVLVTAGIGNCGDATGSFQVVASIGGGP